MAFSPRLEVELNCGKQVRSNWCNLRCRGETLVCLENSEACTAVQVLDEPGIPENPSEMGR